MSPHQYISFDYRRKSPLSSIEGYWLISDKNWNTDLFGMGKSKENFSVVGIC